ncbi:Beta-amylase 8 [Ancistrocladus abbreviatus]
MNSNSNALNPQQQLLDPQMGDFSHPNPAEFQSQPHPHPHPQPQQRRPRGFAATAAACGGNPISATTAAGGGKGRREREKEKERTKLRERHRRAITSRMLAGLRQYGNFPLPARADMNDVLGALAREAGWIVEADGTTYRPSPPAQMAAFSVRSVESPLSASSLKNCSTKVSLDFQQSVLRMDESLSPASFDSVVVTESETKSKNYTSASASPKCLEAHQLMQDVQSGENNFTGTPYVPVYVVLASGIFDNYCQLVDPEGIGLELKHLKSLNVDGVIVECWWGIVEGWSPQKYVWSGYRELFMIVHQFQLKLQVVMAFHEYGGGDSGDGLISLPQWVLEIGKDNQDIFFTDREGRRNTECLSWGIDKERVLRGRTGIEAYFDFMRSFRTEFDDLFAEGVISGVEIGLGASGELKFPSCSERMGWKYPGVGEFQCYDRYLQQNLRRAARSRGHSFWARGPDNAGHYNSKPIETGFFCDRGDYDSYYGRFFLRWYAQILVDHADNVLSLASLAFEETQIIVKIPAIYWWYKAASHAAELNAGYYNPMNQDGYFPVFEVLKKHSVTMKFVCSGFHVDCQEFDEALADPEGLSWQVLNGAWDQGLTICGQNAYPCYDREEHMRLVEASKPRNDPDQRHFAFFAYQLSVPKVQRAYCFSELDHFIKSMHGDLVCDPES